MYQNQRRTGYHSVQSRPSKSKKRLLFKVLILLVVVGGLVFGYMLHKTSEDTNVSSVAIVSTKAPTQNTKTDAASTAKPATPSVASTTGSNTANSAQSSTNPCSTNTLSQLLLVSISERHLWACQGTTSVYDSPVITGMDFLAADLTPPGTYHIYSKQTDQVLKGSDSTGSWDDPVSYWMPFLENQYGIYGFHDATWRPDNAFGNVSPNSPNASHGCVETPLATAKWIYNWTSVGTTVTIVS
ncbi:MAG TPA: L,D-transpeptidase [Candidatus Saccharimonadales bacterium]